MAIQSGMTSRSPTPTKDQERNGMHGGISTVKDEAVTEKHIFHNKLVLLRTLAEKNRKNYENSDSFVMSEICQSIVNSLESFEEEFNHLSLIAENFDLDPNIKANGYRSWMSFANKVTDKAIILLNDAFKVYFFKDAFQCKMAALAKLIKSTTVIMKYARYIERHSETRALFPLKSNMRFTDILSSVKDVLYQESFYGHFIGMQFCDSIANIASSLGVVTTIFSEYYFGEGFSTIFKYGRCAVDIELRAKRMVQLSQYGSVLFYKNLWNLGGNEMFLKMQCFFISNLSVNKELLITPNPVLVKDLKGTEKSIPSPTSFVGEKPLPVHLLSAIKLKKTKLWFFHSKEPSSNEIILHCHGGGFVSQSSRSHETYLRQWALGLSCPIVSVNYTLSPEACFPRALEETFYAYCWVLENAASLGSTCEKIILAGDSAGANIIFGVVHKCIQNNIRLPDGIFSAYLPAFCELIPSPSRLLCLIDPLLTVGCIYGCLSAYVCANDMIEDTLQHEKKLRAIITGQINTCGVSTSSETSEQSKNNEIILSGIMQILSSLSPFPAHPPLNETEVEQMKEEIANEEHIPLPRDFNLTVEKNHLLSPLYTSLQDLKKFPPVVLLTTEMDPFLDDSIEFARKLREAQVSVKLEVLEGLCHGFLNFVLLSQEAKEGSLKCLDLLKSLLRGDI